MLMHPEVAHGRGVFCTDDGMVYCRYFDRGEFAEGRSLQVNLLTCEGGLGLFRNIRGINKLINIGKMYQKDGTTQSGCFFEGKLEI